MTRATKRKYDNPLEALVEAAKLGGPLPLIQELLEVIVYDHTVPSEDREQAIQRAAQAAFEHEQVGVIALMGTFNVYDAVARDYCIFGVELGDASHIHQAIQADNLTLTAALLALPTNDHFTVIRESTERLASCLLEIRSVAMAQLLHAHWGTVMLWWVDGAKMEYVLALAHKQRPPVIKAVLDLSLEAWNKGWEEDLKTVAPGEDPLVFAKERVALRRDRSEWTDTLFDRFTGRGEPQENIVANYQMMVGHPLVRKFFLGEGVPGLFSQSIANDFKGMVRGVGLTSVSRRALCSFLMQEYNVDWATPFLGFPVVIRHFTDDHQSWLVNLVSDALTVQLVATAFRDGTAPSVLLLGFAELLASQPFLPTLATFEEEQKLDPGSMHAFAFSPYMKATQLHELYYDLYKRTGVLLRDAANYSTAAFSFGQPGRPVIASEDLRLQLVAVANRLIQRAVASEQAGRPAEITATTGLPTSVAELATLFEYQRLSSSESSSAPRRRHSQALPRAIML